MIGKKKINLQNIRFIMQRPKISLLNINSDSKNLMQLNHNPNKIYTYRNHKQISSVSDLPVPFSERSSTDLFCTIITAIFAIAMFVTACVVFNNQKLAYMTYPTDGEGHKCTLDNPTYNYLYFTTINDPSKRLCVAKCPNGTQSMLNCLPTNSLSCAKNTNPNFQVQIYPTVAEDTSIGLYCFPQDENLKQQVLSNSGIDERFDFINSLRSIWISAGVALGLGIIFLLLNCCMTRTMVYVSIVLGGLTFLALAVLLFIWNIQNFKSYSPLLFILAIFFIIFGIMLLSAVCFKRNDLILCGQYLQKGVQVIKKQKSVLLLVPIFVILKIGLFALCMFQLLAYWSHSNLEFKTQTPYYAPEGAFSTIMQFLDLLQFLWGLCFLKQAYNFILAACAVTNYYMGDSYIMNGVKSLFRFHWGSVVAGSFLLNFFYIPDLVYDFLKPNENNRGCYKCFTTACCCCDRFFGFARSDAMAFINAVGLPYCNSSRWCEKINYLSSYFDGSQSIFRYFSLGSHVLLAAAATAIGFIYANATGASPHQFTLLFSFAFNLFIVTYLIVLLVDLAQSILLCTLIQKFLKGQDMRQEQLDSSYPTYQIQQPYKMQQSNVNQGYEILPTHH